MRAHKFERRTDAVIRWLERMKSAYRSGAVESAYIDAECARADLETLRTDVFSDIRPYRRNISETIGRLISAALLSVFTVMMMPFPLSQEKASVTLELPSLPPAKAVAEAPAVPPPAMPRKTAKRKPSPRKRPAKVSGQTARPTVIPRRKEIAHDKIYSLIQTGRRALDNDKSVITVN